MCKKIESEYAPRFKNEDLAIHWQVDETRESLDRLLYHLEIKTNFRAFFQESIDRLCLNDNEFKNGLIAADIGAGVCWTSAILAKYPKIKLVYAIDSSINRLKHAKFVTRHFGVEDKVRIRYGTFLEPNIPEKVDLILLCGSLHHCFDEQIAGLFLNMKSLLNPNGKILIANEHYVNWLWVLRRSLSFLKQFRNNPYYSLLRPRTPDPFSGEHWRTKKELINIFTTNGFSYRLIEQQEDLCKDKPNWFKKLGWFYYLSILEKK